MSIESLMGLSAAFNGNAPTSPFNAEWYNKDNKQTTRKTSQSKASTTNKAGANTPQWAFKPSPFDQSPYSQVPNPSAYPNMQQGQNNPWLVNLPRYPWMLQPSAGDYSPWMRQWFTP